MVEWYMGEVTKHHQVMEVVLFDRLRATLHKIDSLQKFMRYRPIPHMRTQKPHPQVSQTLRMRNNMRARNVVVGI